MNRLRRSSSARSPFAGCGILVIAVVVMVFLIGFSIAALFRQFNEIVKFTADRPAPVATVPLENKEAALNQLAERLESFRQKLAGNESVELALTPDDLNLAIAAYEPLRELRGTFHVTAIEGDTLRIAISFPLNGKPRFTRTGETGWITSDPRYLNGTLIAKPALMKREVVLTLDRIEVPNAEVPKEFITQMSPYRLAERYISDPVLGPPMASLTRVSASDGKLVLKRIAGETAEGFHGKDEVNSASKRFFKFFGIIASVFLLVVGAIVYLGLRARRRS